MAQPDKDAKRSNGSCERASAVVGAMRPAIPAHVIEKFFKAIKPPKEEGLAKASEASEGREQASSPTQDSKNGPEHIDGRGKEGMTGLMMAASLGFSTSVEVFLGAGADPTLKDDNEKYPLDHARDSSDTNCIRLIQKRLNGILFDTIPKRDIGRAIEAVDAGADIFALDEEGMSAWMKANAADPDSQLASFLYQELNRRMCKIASQGDSAGIKDALKAGGDVAFIYGVVEDQELFKRSAYQIAKGQGHAETAGILEARMDMEMAGAVDSHNDQKVFLLLRAGAKPV